MREYIIRCVKQDFRKNAALSGPALAEALKRVRAPPYPRPPRPSTGRRRQPPPPSPPPPPTPPPPLQAADALALINRQAMIAGAFPGEPSVLEAGKQRGGAAGAGGRGGAAGGAAGLVAAEGEDDDKSM